MDFVDIANAYQTSSDSDQELILNLALFLANFLGNHLRAIENRDNQDVLLNAHLYMIKISQVDEREIFKICLEYWSKLVAELYEEIQSLPMAELVGMQIGATTGIALGIPLRKNIYSEVLSNLRLVMVEKMVKPEEVLVVENDEGEIVREFLKESDIIVLYKEMREVLVYLTHLDVQDTETILLEKLQKQVGSISSQLLSMRATHSRSRGRSTVPNGRGPISTLFAGPLGRSPVP